MGLSGSGSLSLRAFRPRAHSGATTVLASVRSPHVNDGSTSPGVSKFLLSIVPGSPTLVAASSRLFVRMGNNPKLRHERRQRNSRSGPSCLIETRMEACPRPIPASHSWQQRTECVRLTHWRQPEPVVQFASPFLQTVQRFHMSRDIPP